MKELDDLGDDHAEHPALDHVERGDRHQDQSVLVGAEVPRQELGRETTDGLNA